MTLKAWLKDGKILVDGNGDIILCETCPCDTGVETGCCGNSIPETLTATISGSGDCSCYNGKTVSLTYSSGNSRWEGTLASASGCSNGDLTLYFYCGASETTAGDFRLDVLCSNGGSNDAGNTPDGTETCDPLDVTFLTTTAGLCCNGSGPQNIDVTVTE